jgi:3-methyladenine DNA glycosylase/8-oxoguanine DNA glycosylase
MCMWGATTWLKIDDSGAWYADRTPSGTATVRLRLNSGVLTADAWGEGAEDLLKRVPGLCGLHDAGVEAIEPSHSVVRELQKRMRGYRIGRVGLSYQRLVAAAIAQKVTGANAKPALRQIAWKWGEQAPGPREDLWLLPDPKALRKRAYYEFHPFGVEQHRAMLLKRIAERAHALQRAAAMDPVAGRAHLQKLRGIGPWTSGVVMGGPLGDPDAVPLGDYHLPNIVAWHLAREPRADDDRMLELLEPYTGRRGQVVRMLKAGAGGAPRYGPKSEARDFRQD